MGCRDDLAQLTKGGFGLPESPRSWYLEYRNTLIDIGGRELKLIPGFFCFYHPDGRLRAMACIHVDDTRYAGDVTAHEIWTELHDRLDFGKVMAGRSSVVVLNIKIQTPLRCTTPWTSTAQTSSSWMRGSRTTWHGRSRSIRKR